MAEIFSIYLVNQTEEQQQFFCFLQPPLELLTCQSALVMTDLGLTVRSNSPGVNRFDVPASFVIGAGSCNQPVGEAAQITSYIVQTAAVGEVWTIAYADAPPDEQPSITACGKDGPASKITIATNAFDKPKNEQNHWFSWQSSGMGGSGGFVGTVWSPEPSATISLTPDRVFYVTVGNFAVGCPCPWRDLPPDAAKLTETCFASGEATATYRKDGSWSVNPGRPDTMTPAPA